MQERALQVPNLNISSKKININCSVSGAKNLKYYKCGEVQVEGPRAQNILINYIQEIMQVEY